MTDLERQCEEIRKVKLVTIVDVDMEQIPSRHGNIRGRLNCDYSGVAKPDLQRRADIAWLLDDVAALYNKQLELRRPSDAKEIAQIQERNNRGYAAVLNVEAQLFRDVQSLSHALAESQRDNARLATAVLAQTGRGDSYCNRLEKLAAMLTARDTEIARLQSPISQSADIERIVRTAEQHGDNTIYSLDDIKVLLLEIARLSSPPEERRDIVERQACRKEVLANGDEFGAVVATRDIDALLQDCARQRNAHVVNMARAEAAEKRVRELQALLSNLRLHVCSYGNSKPSDVIWERVAAALASPLPAEGREDNPLQQAAEREARIDRAFVAMRKFDCFFLWDNLRLRKLIGEWVDAALAQPQAEQPKHITADECFAKCSDYSCVRMGACTGEPGRQA